MENDEETSMMDVLGDIAKKHCDVETLVARQSDDLNFYTISVWNLKDALKAASWPAMTQSGWPSQACQRSVMRFR